MLEKQKSIPNGQFFVHNEFLFNPDLYAFFVLVMRVEYDYLNTLYSRSKYY
jgi:hypothetical protein